MAFESSRPRVPDLSFHVFARAVHPDWFGVKTHRRIVEDGWEAHVRIIDGGHVVHWKSDRSRLTEALFGPETQLPESGLMFHANLRRERTLALRPTDDVEYQAGFEVERCDPEVFDHLCAEASLDAAHDAIFFSFSSTNRLSPPAISVIRFEARARGLSIHTFHSIPAERAIVRTHSLFESTSAERVV